MKISFNWWHLLLIVALLLSFFPLIWMVSTSLKETGQIFSDFLNPIPLPITFEHFQHVMVSSPMSRFVFNSFIVAAAATIFQVLTSILAAYALTQFEFRGRYALFYIIVASMLIPVLVTMLPNYLLLSRWGLLNSYAAIILPQLANGMGVFFLRQSFRTIPKALLESAQVEGASDWQRMWLIVVPAVRPMIVAIGIIFFINVWNEYFWPLMVINDENMFTIPLALQLFINSEGGTSWGPMMAVATLASIPPVLAFLLVQKHIISSFLSAGVK
ncbi:Maltose transport system permease protein malG [Chlamydia abortus]|uniref:Carbohydrate ABC transporter permease n=1 Tax=Paenibacillus residui TaxID=629724 RepID=A0ABW3D8L5_9BACL|nr:MULTISPECIES: carbohydrate ABC transporter permease [Paenibacillaceae]SHE14278.1 Maltose transport system permease protein malG [Chlamydia abortus]